LQAVARTHEQMVRALFKRGSGPDRLLVVGRVRYRGRGSGAAMEMPAAWIFDFEDGRCIRLETFSRRVEEAREQARSAPARSATR
jgi:ketosteroid isomerase-like protein